MFVTCPIFDLYPPNSGPSAAQTPREVLSVVLNALRDCNVDFKYVKETYSKVADTDIGDLICDIEESCETIGNVQDDIRKIENPS